MQTKPTIKIEDLEKIDQSKKCKDFKKDFLIAHKAHLYEDFPRWKDIFYKLLDELEDKGYR